jgi:hypothetical protein
MSPWTPADLEGGWWLDSGYGLPANTATWNSRGQLAPGFTKRTTSTAISVDQNGVLFGANGGDFFYESTPVAAADSFTVFGVYRPTSPFTTNAALVGKYATASNQRSWSLLHSTPGNVVALQTSVDGAAGGNTVTVSPSGLPACRSYTFLVRKNGASCDAWFNGVKITTAGSTSATVFASSLPITVGGRGGSASVDCTIPYSGYIRHLGYYNSAINDSDAQKLLAWMQRECQWFVRGSAFGVTDASYPFPAATHAAVAVPDGTSPSQGSPLSHRYRHHVAIGRRSSTNQLWIGHSSGADGEDQPGQQLHVEYSNDDGATWSAPIVAVGSLPGGAAAFGGAQGEFGAVINYARCFVEYNDTLYVVGACEANTSSGLNGIALLARACNSNGSLGPLFRIDTSGPGFSGAPAYDSALGPPLFALANVFGVFGGSAPSTVGSTATWSSWQAISGDSANTWLVSQSTASVDGSPSNLVRLHRCNRTSYSPELTVFWSSRSYDGGVTWTHPTPTDVPNQPSTPCVLRLTDGRFAVLGNAQDYATGIRRRLSMMLFDADGVGRAAYTVRSGVGSVPKYAGTAKNGGPSYHGAVQSGDYVHAAYSVWKEWIGHTSVLIPAGP